MSCRAPRSFFFQLDEETLSSYVRALGLESAAQGTDHLARALASSPPLASAETAGVWVARRGTAPIFALMGSFSEHSEPVLEAQVAALRFGMRHLRVLTPKNVEDACRSLAGKLVSEFGRSFLADARFRAVPRGGLFVLGYLAYLLDLDRDRLQPGAPDDEARPTVLVDDCALTGARLQSVLPPATRRPWIFAPLVSPKELRQAIEDQESRIERCLSVVDLQEKETEALTEGWKQRWLAARKPSGYWIGQLEALVFPWSQPDRIVWNPVRRRTERAWRLVPPRLSNGLAGAPDSPIQPEGPGPLRPADEVLFGELDGMVLVGHVETREVVELEDTATDLWRALVHTGTVDGAVRFLRTEYAVDEKRLRADVETFVETLLDRGLLVDERSR